MRSVSYQIQNKGLCFSRSKDPWDMPVTLQNQDLGLGLTHLIRLYYLILTWFDIFIYRSKTNYNPPLETKDGSCNNYGLSKDILVRKQSPIAVFTDFTDDLGLCICHEVSKTLTVSLKGDLILESSPDCH